MGAALTLDSHVSVSELARMLDAEIWRTRRAVDVVTENRCPRIGNVRAAYGPREVSAARGRATRSIPRPVNARPNSGASPEVDAAIGGKTAVDLPGGKNLVDRLGLRAPW